MFEHADKALLKREEEKADKREKATKAEKTKDEPRPSPPPSRSRSDDRLDEPNVGGALGLGFLGISSGSLASLDEVGGERRGRGEDTTKAKKTAETKELLTKTPMSVAELAKALLAELRGRLEEEVSRGIVSRCCALRVFQDARLPTRLPTRTRANRRAARSRAETDAPGAGGSVGRLGERRRRPDVRRKRRVVRCGRARAEAKPKLARARLAE